MKKGETMPKEIVNSLIKTFKARMSNFAIKPTSKKYIEMQAEFMLGAAAGVDAALGNTETSCISPIVYIGVIRGEVLNES